MTQAKSKNIKREKHRLHEMSGENIQHLDQLAVSAITTCVLCFQLRIVRTISRLHGFLHEHTSLHLRARTETAGYLTYTIHPPRRAVLKLGPISAYGESGRHPVFVEKETAIMLFISIGSSFESNPVYRDQFPRLRAISQSDG